MDAGERYFAFWVGTSHAIEHFLRRLFPPLVPIWVVAFDFSLATAGLLLGAQTLGSALGQAPFGVLADRYDRRYILPTGIAFAAFCVAVFGTVPFLGRVAGSGTIAGFTVEFPFVIMLLAMTGVGFGGSVLHPAGYPLITENVSESRKGRMLGFWGSAAKLGDGAAPAVVGVLLLVLSWPNILVVLGLVIIGYSVGLFVVMGRFESRPSERLGSADEDPNEDGSEPADSRTDESSDASSPDVWSIDRRVYVYPMLALFAFYAVRVLVTSGLDVFIPEFITSEYGYSFVVFGFELTAASSASFYYSALLITAAVAQLGTGWLADEYDPRLIVIALVLIASGGLAVLVFAHLSPLFLLLVVILLGGSFRSLNPARDAIISSVTPQEREGRTFGYLGTGALLVSVFAPWLVGYIGDHAGLRVAFGLMAGVSLLSVLPVAVLYSDRVYVSLEKYEAENG